MAYDDHFTTCLSSYSHSSNVRDEVLHYFGCLRDNERGIYFSSLPEHKQHRIQQEKDRINELRSLFKQEEDLAQRGYCNSGLRPSCSVRELNDNIRVYRNVKAKGLRPSKRIGEPVLQEYKGPCKENGFGMSARAIFFRKAGLYNDPLCTDIFPD